MDTRAFIDRLYEKASGAGFDDFEIYYSGGEAFRAMVFKGEVNDYSVNTSAGISFRAMVDGKMGYAYTEAMDDDAIDMLIEKAKENASVIESEDEQFIFGGSDNYEPMDVYNPALDDVPASEKIDLALSLEKQAIDKDERIESVGYCMTQSASGNVIMKNSKGLNLEHRENFIIALVEPVAKKGDRMKDAFSYSMGRDIKDIDSKGMIEESVEEAVDMLDAKGIPSGSYKIIFSKDAAGDLLSTFSGIFSAESAQKGLSLLKGKEGETIAADIISIMDDPLMKDGYASAPFDAEGVATYTKAVVENGVLKTLLYNLKTAAKDGVKTTGNASKSSYKAPVNVSPFNFYIKPSETSVETLMEHVGEGLYITDLEGLHSGANPVSGDFSLSAKGYLITGGKKAHTVEQFTVAGNFYDVLKNAIEVGSDLKFGMPGSSCIGSPSISVGEMPIAGE